MTYFRRLGNAMYKSALIKCVKSTHFANCIKTGVNVLCALDKPQVKWQTLILFRNVEIVKEKFLNSKHLYRRIVICVIKKYLN